jgi:hypothetical protein
VIAFCTKTDKAWKRVKSAAARLLVAAAALCSIVAPLRAAEPDREGYLNSFGARRQKFKISDSKQRSLSGEKLQSPATLMPTNGTT